MGHTRCQPGGQAPNKANVPIPAGSAERRSTGPLEGTTAGGVLGHALTGPDQHGRLNGLGQSHSGVWAGVHHWVSHRRESPLSRGELVSVFVVDEHGSVDDIGEAALDDA